MFTREQVESRADSAYKNSEVAPKTTIVIQNDIIITLLLDVRELLQQKSKPRRILVEEAPMNERERELLNSLEEKE